MKNSLLCDFLKYNDIISNYRTNNIFDTSKYYFLEPTTLVPLLDFIENNDISLKNQYINTNLVSNSNEGYNISLPKTMLQRQELAIVENIINNIDKDYNLFIVHYALNEIINNIYEHSALESNSIKNGQIYIKENSNVGKLDICIRDNGLSIGRNFRLRGMNVNDCQAICLATSKTSTSDEKDEKDKGNGLWSTIRCVIEGNGGNILIVSGKCYLYIHSSDKYKYGKLTENYFKGTMVSVRLFKNPFLKRIYGDDSLLEPNSIPEFAIKYNW